VFSIINETPSPVSKSVQVNLFESAKHIMIIIEKT